MLDSLLFLSIFKVLFNLFVHTQLIFKQDRIENSCCQKSTIQSKQVGQLICSWHLQFSLHCAAFLHAGNSLCSRHLRVCAWREHIYTLHRIFPSCTFLLLLAVTIITGHPESWQALSSKLQSNWLTFNLGSKGLLLLFSLFLWYHLFYF